MDISILSLYPNLSTLAHHCFSDTSLRQSISVKYVLANKHTAHRWQYFNDVDLILILLWVSCFPLGVMGEAFLLETDRGSLQDLKLKSVSVTAVDDVELNMTKE